MENNPVAAAPSTEAPINSNPAPAAPAPTEAPAPAAPQANIPTEQIEAFNRFVSANGGFETAFSKMKAAVSRPQQPAQPQAQPMQQMQQMQQPVQQLDQHYQPRQIPKGYVTQEEIAAKQYFDGIANEENYAGISGQIRSGEIFKEMSKFGIRPVVNGMVNDKGVRDFLDLYAKTVPAVQTSEAVTSTPTVEYVNVGEQVSSRDDALRILQQNRSLNGAGMHPQTEAAKAYLANYFKAK